MNSFPVERIIERIKEIVGCSQTAISQFSGIAQNTLSENKNTPIEEIKNRKTGKRLLALLFLVERIHYYEPFLDTRGYFQVINSPISEDPETGALISCSWAIKRGQPPYDYLDMIAQKSIAKYKQQISSKENSLFEEIKTQAQAV